MELTEDQHTLRPRTRSALSYRLYRQSSPLVDYALNMTEERDYELDREIHEEADEAAERVC